MKIDKIKKNPDSHISGGYSKSKAGIIPYFSDGTSLFFLSNNEKFGGLDPSIAKGGIDEYESAEHAAIREGEEELGLQSSNFKNVPELLWKGKLTGMNATYEMSVYAVEVKSKTNFSKAGSEAGSTRWLTLDEFKDVGRKSHWHIVKKMEKFLNTNKR